MRLLKYFSLIVLTVFAFACKKEDETTIKKNLLEDLKVIQTIKNETHQITLYSESGKLKQGYNKVFFQVKSNDGSIVQNADVSWTPMMHMKMMSHGCPTIQPTKTNADNSIYQAELIFQMAGNDTEYWDLTINYSINNQKFSAKERLNVVANTKQTVSSFRGTDNIKYIVAMVNPSLPKVGINDIEAYIFKMDDMTTFSKVDDYTLEIDPRMTGMGNHGSPNNIHLTQATADGLYKGKISFTMTGYWKINLKLLDKSKTILKGESVTGAVESSSIYWEVEF